MRSFRERFEALTSQESRPVTRVSVGIPIDQIEPGTIRRNSAGECFVVEVARADERLASLRGRDALRSSIFFGPGNDAVRSDDLLFLDTETTGLAGGTGTHAFLVGIGFFEGDRFVLRQYFMRSPAEERAVLEELRELFERFRILVTFNGKSFDWPLIDTRFLLHGYRLDFSFDHLDLLHPARRIWKHRLASCSLTSLEQGVFGVYRTGDVPGYLIPQLYFDYLRDGDARRLSSVFSHNREDIVTLAGLMELLISAETDPFVGLSHAEDQIGLGLALIAAGATDAGYQTLARALSASQLRPDVRKRGEIELWRVMKRRGNLEDGIEMLEVMCQAASRSATLDLFPFVELAKYYEHAAREFNEAERVVEHALRLLDLRGQSVGRAELAHRLNRIRRKRASLSAPAAQTF